MHDNKLKVIAFDLDNTLYSEQKYFEAVIVQFCKQHGFNDELLIKDFHTIGRDSKDIFGDILKKRGIYTDRFQELFFGIYRTIEVKINPFPVAVEVLSCLKRYNIGTAIITNGNIEAQRNKIECLDIAHFFDTIIYARSWGKEFEKPHPKPFKFLLEYFSCSPHEVLFLGDREEIDIDGARKLGMKAIRVNNEEDIRSVIKYIL